LESPASPSPEETPAAPPAAPPRADDAALDAALTACATLLARVGPAAASGDRAVLLALAPVLRDAAAALDRLEATPSLGTAEEGGGDPLTGLAGHAGLAAASAALARQHPDAPLTLVAVDVDHLRHVNDAWSRATGDAVLQAVAGVLRAQSRPHDALARVDADLFVVALGGPVSTTRALLVAERLRAAVEAYAWSGLGSGLRVTASVGVAVRAPGEPLAEGLARVRLALRECKRAGRNQVRSQA
jgi:diguanylate cyclase (GGDEF)-like protein